MRPLRFSPGRVFIIARHTFLEAVRQRLVAVLVIVALVLVGSVQFFREFNFGSSELKFIADFGFGAVTLFGSVLAIVAAAQLFFSEIENRTALTLLAKPVFRSEFLLGKFLGVQAVLLAFTLLVTLALALTLWWRESALMAVHGDEFEQGRLVDYSGVAMFAVLQWLKLGIIAAFTMFVATYANTNLFTVLVSFVILLICHLQYLAREAWERLDAFAPRVAAAALGYLFPNFQLFNLGDRLAPGGAGLSAMLTLSIAGYGLIYVAVFLALAVASFRRREI